MTAQISKPRPIASGGSPPDAPVVSRREPAGLLPSADLKATFGVFCANVRRLNCLTPTNKDIAILIFAKVTLKRGFSSFAFRSLGELTQLSSGGAPFGGFGKNDLSAALSGAWRVKVLADGSAKRIYVPGLIHFGMAKVENLNAPDGALPWSVLTVFADVRQWLVRASDWSYVPEDEQRLADHWEACSRRFTQSLPELGVASDLIDGLSVVKSDAPDVRPDAGSGAGGSGRSDFRNADLPAKTVRVLTFGTTTRARAAEQFNGKTTETVQRLNCSGNAGETNRLLRELKEQFARAHGQAQADAEMERSGGFWRKVATRWPDLFEREVGALRAHINEGGKFTRAAWFMFCHYFLKSIGATTWQEAWIIAQKKLEDS